MRELREVEAAAGYLSTYQDGVLRVRDKVRGSCGTRSRSGCGFSGRCCREVCRLGAVITGRPCIGHCCLGSIGLSVRTRNTPPRQ